MARIIGWDYEEGDRVIVTVASALIPWEEETYTAPMPVGTVGLAQGPVDSDGEVMVVWPEKGSRSYIHFALIAPVPADLPTKPMAPDEIEEFLKKEDPWN